MRLKSKFWGENFKFGDKVQIKRSQISEISNNSEKKSDVEEKK